MKKLCFLVVSMLLAWNAAADTFYVDLAGSNTPPYTTPATAAHSLQDAIDAAAAGDTISVAAGTYDGQVVVNKDRLVLLGPNAGIDPCIGGRGSEAILEHTGGTTAIGTASTVVFTDSDSSTIDGFTIKSTETSTNQVAVLIGGNFVGDGTRPSDGNIVRFNIINGGRTNVYIWQSKDNSIENNELVGPHESSVFVGDCDTSGDPLRSPTGNAITDNCIDKAGTGALGNGIQLATTCIGSSTDNDYSGTRIARNIIKDTSGGSLLFRGIDTDEIYGLTSDIAIDTNTVTNATENFGNCLNLKNSSNISADGNDLDADSNRCVVATNVQDISLANNIITSDGATGGGWQIVGFTGGTSDVTMTGNEITVSSPSVDGRVVYLVDVTGTNDISENEISVTGTLGGASAFYHGLDIFGASASADFVIAENDLTNSATTAGPALASVGIRLRSSLDASVKMDIKTNIITGWDSGIRSDDLASGIDVNVIDCNQIFSNTSYGVLNGTGTGETIDATGNWWGDASGPSGAGSGSGDAVSADVLFDPWGNTSNCDVLVPVELLTFAAELTGDGVRLSWATASETENLGFHVYRSSSADGEYTRLNESLIPGAGTSAETHHYSFTDAIVEAGNTYWYRLADVDFNGRTTFHDPIEVTVDAATRIGDGQGLPQAFALQQNYPNPFNPSTQIRFALPQASDVSLAIYSLGGQLVKTLAAGQMSAGHHSVTWDGTDARGLRVASGVFLYVIRAGDYVAQKKLVLAK